MKQLTKPMGRDDLAWLMACVISGIFIAVLASAPEFTSNNGPQVGTRTTYTFASDGKPAVEKSETFEVPQFHRQIIIRTNDKLKDIVGAVDAIGLSEKDFSLETRVISHPKFTWSDFMETVFEAILAFIFVSGLFRILEKICRRILGIKTVTAP